MMKLSKLFIRMLLPRFKSGHTRYVEIVKTLFQDGCRWLDAGGGRRIFHDVYDGEKDLITRAGDVVVCDVDQESLKDHVCVTKTICCNLTSIPLGSNSFDFITCGMVVEHLDNPEICIRELARLLDSNGKLIIHTVNLFGYPTMMAIASKWLPFRKKIIAKITARKEEDIFPTLYRCNTEAEMRRFLNGAGLHVEDIQHLDAGIIFDRFWPLALLECLYIRLTRPSIFSRLRGQILVVASKP